jgi:hypothetical protein
MRRPTFFLSLPSLAASLLAVACGGADGATGVDGRPAPSPDAPKIDAAIAALPDWIDNAPTPRAPVARTPVYLREAVGSDMLDYRCGVTGQNMVKVFPKVLAAGSNLSNLYPGALVQGATLRGGNPAVINELARAPITMRISLPIAKQSIEVRDVNSVTMAQAIADLQRSAATEQGVRDVIPANMIFELVEANTFDQSATALGVAAGYSNPIKGIEAGGNINSSTSRSVRTNSVVVKFVQEMYTIQLAEDLLPNGSSFFDRSVRETDLQALIAAGKFGPDNLPLYVESITYGRVLFFSARSTDVSDVNELKTAMNLAGRAFSGGASLSTRQKTLLNTATYQIVPFGGPQSAATAAIASLDWTKFFVPAEATTAVPIAFTVKTLKGRQAATIHNNVLYDERSACAPPKSYSLDVTLTRVERASGFCLSCIFTTYVKRSGTLFSTFQTGVFGPGTGPKTYNNKKSFTLAPGQGLEICNEFDTGASCMPFGYPGAVNGNLNNMKQMTSGTERTFTNTVNALGASGKFTWKAKKVANY